jgi:hypothetical protein
MSRVPHIKDNSTYLMTCHYITCDTCNIYATSNAKNNNKNYLNLKNKNQKKKKKGFKNWGWPTIPIFCPRGARATPNLQNGGGRNHPNGPTLHSIFSFGFLEID